MSSLAQSGWKVKLIMRAACQGESLWETTGGVEAVAGVPFCRSALVTAPGVLPWVAERGPVNCRCGPYTPPGCRTVTAGIVEDTLPRNRRPQERPGLGRARPGRPPGGCLWAWQETCSPCNSDALLFTCWVRHMLAVTLDAEHARVGRCAESLRELLSDLGARSVVAVSRKSVSASALPYAML